MERFQRICMVRNGNNRCMRCNQSCHDPVASHWSSVVAAQILSLSHCANAGLPLLFGRHPSGNLTCHCRGACVYSDHMHPGLSPGIYSPSACPQAPQLVAAGEQLLPPVERLCAAAAAGAVSLEELDSVLTELSAVTQVAFHSTRVQHNYTWIHYLFSKPLDNRLRGSEFLAPMQANGPCVVVGEIPGH